MQQINLAQHAPISNWKPEIGNFIVWHGWFQHWFGVICDVGVDEVTVIHSGIPILLFTLTQSAYDKNKKIISLGDIKSGGSFWGGKYAAIKAHGNNLIWYV